MTINSELTKGFRDYTGKESEKKEVVKEVIRQTFELERGETKTIKLKKSHGTIFDFPARS